MGRFQLFVFRHFGLLLAALYAYGEGKLFGHHSIPQSEMELIADGIGFLVLMAAAAMWRWGGQRHDRR